MRFKYLDKIIINKKSTIKQVLENFNKTAIKRNRIKTPSYNQVINPLNTSSIGRWKNYDKMKNIEKLVDILKH